jgi:hypothetical protein
LELYSLIEKAMINKSLTIGNELPNPNGRSPDLAARASHFALERGKPKQRTRHVKNVTSSVPKNVALLKKGHS